jgi:hypothetical protein
LQKALETIPINGPLLSFRIKDFHSPIVWFLVLMKTFIVLIEPLEPKIKKDGANDKKKKDF